jgi:hypothetical protein
LGDGRPAWLDISHILANLFAHLLEALLLVAQGCRLDFISVSPGRAIFLWHTGDKVVHFVLLQLNKSCVHPAFSSREAKAHT